MLRWVVLALAFLLTGCAGKGPSAAGETTAILDGDPLALLPGSAIATGTLDARSLLRQGTLAGPLSELVSALLPLGDDAGLVPSRDLERVVLATYASTGSDVALVLRGHFDPAKLAAVDKDRNGAGIARGVYAGWPTFSIGAVSYAVLTPRTMVAGTGDGLRRTLERVRAGTFEPVLSPWVRQTLDTPGAQIALAADFATQPIVSATMGSLKLPWLEGLRIARVIANLAPPGMNVAATLSYGSASQAQSALEGVRFLSGWLKVLGPLIGGARVQDLEVSADGTDVRGRFALDDASLAALLSFAARAYATRVSAPAAPAPSAAPPAPGR